MPSSPTVSAALDRVAAVARFSHGHADQTTARAIVRAVDLGAQVPAVAGRARVPEQTVRRVLIEAASAYPSVEW